MPVRPGARLTRAAAEVAMISALAEPERWPALASAIGKAVGGPLLGLSGFLLGRDEAGAFTNFLVVGNAFDPEAPLDSVRQVAGLLGSGRLIVADRDGHGSYGTGSSCVDAHVDAYLLDGTLPPGPAREVRCR
ncbi:alpha/beta hydrolase [Pseudonocardia acaciae]|uniref:alpha/beta hydrolase n=1 Tax=Pseudonocardia acaciae TaxID=551276 RepID=UPI0014703E37|nr:alpha/beta hydrolase [Pseudonocardia acaciae]